MAPARGNLPPPTFDLETYANNYEGALLPFRLAHIALNCPSLARHALTLAISHAKYGKDVQLYNRLAEIAASLGMSELAQQDTDWAVRRDEENRREQTRLESELRGYKNNLIRESIRMGQEDLATHLMLTGGPVPDPTNPQSLSSAGYNAAYHQFGKMRDYCTTPTHINAMNLRLIYTAMLQTVSTQLNGGSAALHLQSLHANGNRLRSSGVKEDDMSKLAPVQAVSTGLAQMGLGEYHAAARHFLATPFEYHHLGPVHNIDFERSVANANDVAIYGGLCALATMSREDLVDTVLGGPFRAFLELEPHMRKAIGLYTTAKYQACIDTLQRYYSDWNLDIFLGAKILNWNGSHVDRLFARIRERSITAYFSSFSEVSLASLASTFPPPGPHTEDAMEREVLAMIENGTLNARLDAVRGVVLAPQKEPRSETHLAAKTTAEDVERTLLLRLHKVNMTLAGLEIFKPKTTWDAVRGNGY